ncbi:MAG: DMT family transporter [Syntrophomonadaceae bacterium]|jgi:drug/metabolite transporter (DMT)-like permease|nr:DMT family transporter [Syntrophomonadaceae bacterium]
MNGLSPRLKADLSMLFVAFIWGTTFVIVKNALLEIGPFLYLGLRFLLAFAVLALLSPQNIGKVNRHSLTTGMIMGLVLLFGYAFQTVGLQYTTSSNAGFITGVSVVLVPIIYYSLRRRLPPTGTIFAVVSVTIGLYLLSVPNGLSSMAYGDLLILVCALCFAIHIVLVDLYSHLYNAIAITGIQILFVGLVCLGIGLLIEPWPAKFSFSLIVAIIVTAVFATALAFLIQNALQKYSTPTRFAIVLTAEPVFAALAGYWCAGEMFSTKALIGASLILGSMIISILSRRLA